MTSTPRRILVTGARCEIGLATARQLAATGHEVVMVSRETSRGTQALSSVAADATGPGPSFLPADLSSQASIRDLSVRLHDRFSSVDALVNNSGTSATAREITVEAIVLHYAPHLI